MNRVHILVSGDVRGVGFRFSTIQTARELGLTGWVRNIEGESRVEIVAEGPSDKLENLITWARKGPPLARVDKVDVERQKATGEFNSFEVKRLI